MRVITAMRADVVCVQEAPRLPNWRARRRDLAARCGLRVAAGRRLGGVAVLTGPRVRVLHAESHVLRVFAGLEIRGLAVAVVEVEGARLAVGSLHLDLDGPARFRHAAEAMALMRGVAGRFGAEIVLGADLNEHAHQPAWRYLAAQLTDCYAEAPDGDGLTFTARRPQHRIDALFAARGMRVISCGRADASKADLAEASDHLPVLAELRVVP
ncbi:endonuclease/exonuclease/phosphatase family protein [Nonomuraea sp. LPB2021202275-12-8]|uniref:endonuclease/exonuclease/phosphatase family protein n=1 Tax=Nonomuraea sp. LPB2021202275-12-8 TaxID=3120159 RepID=UPI00300CF180